MNSEFYFVDTPEGVRLLKNKRLDAFSELAYCFTTRIGGVSTGECNSLNLSWKRRDSYENVKENHTRMARAIGVEPESIVFVQLTHSDKVLVVDKSYRNDGKWWETVPVGYDAVITNDTETTLLARTADCGTVLLYDPVKKVIGAVHSGWKGTVKGIITNTVKKMIEVYACDPKDLVAVCGPSICRDCFKVHLDCAQQFFDAFCKGRYDTLCDDGRYSIDMWSIMLDQLLDCGIQSKNISMAQDCTCCDELNYFSHRRGKGKSGIMLAVIHLKNT